MSDVLTETRSAFADAARELRAGWSWAATLWALAFATALLATVMMCASTSRREPYIPRGSVTLSWPSTTK